MGWTRVAIVGAGPAGLMAAGELAAAGEKPVILEKSSEVASHIRCGEAIFDQYDLFTSDPPGTRARIKAVKFNFRGIYTFPTHEIKVWILDKDVWLRQMASSLETQGAEIRLDSRVHLGPLRKEFDYVLDCSGCPSLASSEYGLSGGACGLAIQLRVSADLSHIFGELHLFFSPGEVGYRWIFPKTKTLANVGIGWAEEAPSRKWETLRRFAGEQLGDYDVVSRTTGCVPFRPVKNPVVDNLLLCGDAAGLANPYHGGGIHNALISGKLAARAILNGHPESYSVLVREAIDGEFKVASFARFMLEDTYHNHERLISYLERRYNLGELFTMETYRRLFPYMQLWRLRGRLLGREFQAF